MRDTPITAAASGPDPLLSLMQLTDSALPTGAFSQSLGFETYMQRGQIHDEGSFAEWLQMFADQQLTYTDALAIRLVYAAREVEEVVDLDELATVQALPQQVRDGGITMGRRLLSIGAASYPGRGPPAAPRRCRPGACRAIRPSSGESSPASWGSIRTPPWRPTSRPRRPL